jgi:hypothetical protein
MLGASKYQRFELGGVAGEDGGGGGGTTLPLGFVGEERLRLLGVSVFPGTVTESLGASDGT